MDRRILLAARIAAKLAGHPREFTVWTLGRALVQAGAAESEQEVLNVLTAISYDLHEIAEDEDGRLFWVD